MNEPNQPARRRVPGSYAAENRRRARPAGEARPHMSSQQQPSRPRTGEASGQRSGMPVRRRRRRHPYAHLVKPGLIFAAVLTLLIVLICDYNSFDLEVRTDEVLTAAYGEQYKPEGVEATLTGGMLNSDKKAKVELAEPLNTDQLGETEVTFRIKCDTWWLFIPRSFETKITKTIEVVDTVAPVITLKTAEVCTNYRGATYREEGFTAIDNCDGDISDKVTSVQNGDQVTYTVTDSSGNTATAVRQIQYLEGAESNGMVIYLTFDDGPGKYTTKLLEILGKYNVKATFFVVNTDYTDLISDIAAEGHSVAVHSYSHELKKIYQSEAAYYEDLEKMQEVIVAETGQRSNLIRFPGGSSNQLSDYNPGIMTRLSKSVQEKGYYYFDWNIDSDDAGRATTAEEVFRNVTTGIEREAKKNRTSFNILQHDIKGFSVDAVEQIILWGLENGYTFLPLDETSPGSHHKIFN